MKKRISSFIIAILIALNSFTFTFAYSDDRILTDTIVNTYNGRIEAPDMIRNANFIDIPADYWAKESIVRMTALNLVKGYGKEYKPNNSVSNQEAIAYFIRAIGQEDVAQAAGIALQPTFPTNSSVRSLWSLGYLQLAMDANVITQAQYDDALIEDQTTLDPNVNFIRDNAVTREQAADWLVKTLEFVDPAIFQNGTTQQSIYQYSDWETITPEMVSSIEKLSMSGIMSGTDGKFNPKGNITRAEIAQMLRNMDSIYYNMNGITKRTGTVGAVLDKDDKTTGILRKIKEVYVRTSDGKVDVIQYTDNKDSSPQPQTEDALVCSPSVIGGLSLLEENDQIEYLTDSTNTILYVQKISETKTTQIQGVLDTVDRIGNSITIRDGRGNKTTYRLIEGLIKDNAQGQPYLYMDLHERLLSNLPIGSTIKLTLKNDIVTTLNYVGEPEVYTEIRGIVTENNPELGYITVIGNDRKEITKNYYKNTIKVEKRQYYDVMDEIGYIDSIFPNFDYDDRDTFIDDIEAGDIVYLTLDSTNQEFITSASASTNYTMKYGKVKQIQLTGDEFTSILMEYENNQTEWIDVPSSIFISRDTQPANLNDILPGDRIKVLVNEAIIAPGNTIQSAKEITIEGSDRYVSNIYKAQLSSINKSQQEIIFKNVQSLDNTGWSNYQQTKNIKIDNNQDVKYYYNGNRISLDFASSRLKNNYEAYIATESGFGGEKAVKISFRDSRDELLKNDNIMYADGNGTIGTTNKSSIATDEGTIVVRYGRETDNVNIMVPDYATIALNGENKAALVVINDTPNTAGLIISRGRINTIDEGKSFQVKSMSILGDMNWAYTPIQRTFTIDYDTQFFNADGWVEPSEFIDYTDETKADKVYTIITDGSKATQIIDNPYVQEGVRGTIYAIEEDVVKIKDAYTYNRETGAWTSISNRNTALNITIPDNYIIVKDNKSEGLSSLKVGNQIKVMTDVLPEKPTETTEINGYITFVEK